MTSEEKFHAAVNVIRSLPKNGSYQPSNELMLRFYSYFKQATQGPCKGNRPAFWDVVGRIKHDAWKKLGSMSKQEAMDLYVAELHRIVETMSYTDNVANFLEAQASLDTVPLGDLELVAGDVIERVRSQPNSPFASREASPQRGVPIASLETSPASSQYSSSPQPLKGPDLDSDDEYIDTLEDSVLTAAAPATDIGAKLNGIVSSRKDRSTVPPRASRAKTKPAVDITPDIQRAVESLRVDIERLSGRLGVLEKRTPPHKSLEQRRTTLSFQNIAPTLLAFIVLWPIVTNGLFRFYSRK